MLRIQAALWAFTGSREMSVFQMLLAGNIGQFGAPGTVVPPPAGLAGRGWMAARPVPVPAPGASPSLAASTAPWGAPEPCGGPDAVLTAAVPHAARKASGAASASRRAGVVRS